MSTTDTKNSKSTVAKNDAPTRLLDVSKFSYKDFYGMTQMNDEDRAKAIEKATKDEYSSDDLKNVVPMTFSEEFIAMMLFLFGVPGAVFSLPVVIGAIGFVLGNFRLAFTIGGIVGVSLAFWPAPFVESSLSSWAALQIIRYFSFKGIFEVKLSPKKPYILVAPPHGVFPFGNITTMIAFPSVMGFSFRALAASAAIRTPVYRQILCKIGCIDASRKVAEKTLRKNLTLGISTGGVAEVFETDLSASGNEVIVLKSRKGIVKLAFLTGAELVPCYLFGNTHLLSLWCGGAQGSSLHTLLRNISRKIGFALIFFWGRFGLPIPYRVPIVGVMSKPISVPQKDNPSDEEVEHYLNILMEEMVKLFDKHKANYGWANKQLIIR